MTIPLRFYSLLSLIFLCYTFFAMDEKTLITLEYPKILERLAGYASFGISADMARAMRPSSTLDDARLRLAFTTEARRLLEVYGDFSIGGARDVRDQVDLARRAGVLDPGDLLDVKNTLIAARNVARTLRYDSRANLIAMGVIEDARRRPDPFPAAFVPDPR